MPQTTIDARGTVRTGPDGDLVTLLIEHGDESVTSTILLSKVDTPEKLANWALVRHYQARQEYDVQKRVTFTWHTDTEPGTGDQYPVLDSIDDVQPIPPDAGRTGVENLPGWSSWSAQEASDWIAANVVADPSVIIVLSSMAKMLIYLRKIVTGE